GTVSFSAGVATYPQHGRDRSELVRVGDIALYWAKGEGKNRVRVYRADMPPMTQLQRLATDPDRTARLQAAAALAGAVDARDAYVGSHSYRVGEDAAAVAERLDLPRAGGELIRLPGQPAAPASCTPSASSRSPRRSCASAARSPRASARRSSGIRRSARTCSTRSGSSRSPRGCCTTTSGGTATGTPATSQASRSRSGRG